MLNKLTHSINPVAVIIAATVLGAMRVIDSATAVALIAGAGGYGAIAVGKAAAT